MRFEQKKKSLKEIHLGKMSIKRINQKYKNVYRCLREYNYSLVCNILCQQLVDKSLEIEVFLMIDVFLTSSEQVAQPSSTAVLQALQSVECEKRQF